MVDDLEPHEEEEDFSKDPLGEALAGARSRPPRDPMSLPGMQNTSEPEFHPGKEPFSRTATSAGEPVQHLRVPTEEQLSATRLRVDDLNPPMVGEGFGFNTLPNLRGFHNEYSDDDFTYGTFKDLPFNTGTGFTMGEPMELAWRLLKGDTIRKAWPEDSFADHSGFANPDGTPYEGDQEGLMQQRAQEIADVHNMTLGDLYRVYGWEPDEHTGHGPEEIQQVRDDWDHPWHTDWDDFENAIINKNSIKAHTNFMLDSGVKMIDGNHGPSGNSWTMGTTDPNWMETHADEIARQLEFNNDLYGHYTAEPAKHGDGLMGDKWHYSFGNHDDIPGLNWNPPLEETHGEEWFNKKHIPHRNPLTEGSYYEDTKNDPFRMTRPDIESEIEEMATEMGRRQARKKHGKEMGWSHPGYKAGTHTGWDHVPIADITEEDYAAGFPMEPPEFHEDFDEAQPQNRRLINVTAPHMREREAALNEELDRRAEKGRKNRV